MSPPSTSGAGPPGPASPDGPAAEPSRPLTDREVADLIRRAIQLQESASDPAREGDPDSGGGELPREGRGLTLRDVRQIAAEVGIEARWVDRAARERGADIEREGSRLLGGDYSWELKRQIEGELPEEDRVRVLEAIRSVMKTKGEVDDVFGRVEWSYDDGLGAVIVSVGTREGITEVDVTARRTGEVGLWHSLGASMGGILGGAALAGVLGVDGAAVLPGILAMGGVSFLGARQLWSVLSARWERKLGRLSARVADAVTDATAARLPTRGEEDP